MAAYETSAIDHSLHDRPFTTRALSEDLGVEILGITMEEAVAPDVFPQIFEAFLQHQLILFDDVDLPPETQVAFARKFGEVQIHVMDQYHAEGGRYPEIYFLTNLDRDGNPSGSHPDKGTMHWHTDGSWKSRTGQATMMYSETVPDAGGETHFANMYSAWEALEQSWKDRLSGLKAVHNLDFSRSRRHGEDPLTDVQKSKIPPVVHPVVRTHPETGRRAIFLGDHAESIEGMPYEEGRALIEAVNVMTTPEDRVYRHCWQPRQCIVWDNRCLLHKATSYDTANAKRVMRRCTIVGDEPF